MTEMYIANICTTDTQSETCKLQRPGQNMSHLLLRIDANDSVNPVFHCEDVYNGPINMHAQIHTPSWFKSVSSLQTKGQHACVLQLRIWFHNLIPQSLGLMLPGEPSGGETVLLGDLFLCDIRITLWWILTFAIWAWTPVVFRAATAFWAAVGLSKSTKPYPEERSNAIFCSQKKNGRAYVLCGLTYDICGH